MIQLYCGEGKGKTTAAVGQAVRAAGSGLKVIFAQFMKGNDTGELHVLRQISGIEILRSPKNFGFYNSMTEQEKRELTEIHNEILNKLLLAAEEKRCGMIILDEVTYPVSYHLLQEEKLRDLLSFGNSENGMEIVLTGRKPEAFLTECADYITRMEAVRHPYEKGIPARKGIEY